jgi:hypothetical protein
MCLTAGLDHLEKQNPLLLPEIELQFLGSLGVSPLLH